MPKPRTSRAARVRLSRLSHSAIARSARLRIEQTVQVNDEVAHVRVVDARLSLRLPSRVGRGVVRIDPDEIDLRKILEAHAREVRELSAKDEVKELTLRLSAHVRVPYGFERPNLPRTSRSQGQRGAVAGCGRAVMASIKRGCNPRGPARSSPCTGSGALYRGRTASKVVRQPPAS